jgi:hypothetical protein
MGGGRGLMPKGDFRLVRHVTVDKAKLEKIADLLGVPKSERAQLHSAELQVLLGGKAPRGTSRKKK